MPSFDAISRSRAGRMLAAYVEQGLERHDSRTRRRLAFNGGVALLAGGLSYVYLALFLWHDAAGLAPLIASLFVASSISIASPLFNRFGEAASMGSFCGVWMVALGVHAWFLGRDAGVHLFYLNFAGGAMLFLGTRRPLGTALFSLTALAMLAVGEIAFVSPGLPAAADEGLAAATRGLSLFGVAVIYVIGLGHSLLLADAAEDALEAEHARSERLLENLLPPSVAARLKAAPERIIADDVAEISLLFADIVDFAPRAARLPAPEVVRFLNRVFSEFDRLTAARGLEKIKTVGDAYLAAAGAPEPRADHADAAAALALDMLAACDRLSEEAGERIEVRIGLHAGSAVAGVIGTRKVFYDVWGDAVNTAARMESHGEPGRVQVTGAFRAALGPGWHTAPRGPVEVKGLGVMETYWLLGRRGQPLVNS